VNGCLRLATRLDELERFEMMVRRLALSLCRMHRIPLGNPPPRGGGRGESGVVVVGDRVSEAFHRLNSDRIPPIDPAYQDAT
jgi:hypothetical protein